ncbi:MAG: hypothetical protein HY520_04905 [Candidatus Aenigmarchaeota archaeon]|nr:hypothetical protein [Candidatus Aenigmarchaeota archaeon]
MKLEKHLENLRETLAVLGECVQKGLYTERQRTIGFHCSAGAVDLVEVYLHRDHLIDPGKQLKHDWFLSLRKAQERLDVDFPHKQRILELLLDIETRRDLLCYGPPQEKEMVQKAIGAFNQLKALLESTGVAYE